MSVGMSPRAQHHVSAVPVPAAIMNANFLSQDVPQVPPTAELIQNGVSRFLVAG
jgi:hypothetical protein